MRSGDRITSWLNPDATRFPPVGRLFPAPFLGDGGLLDGGAEPSEGEELSGDSKALMSISTISRQR